MTAKADFSARPFSMRGEWYGKEDKGTDFLMLKVLLRGQIRKTEKIVPCWVLYFLSNVQNPTFQKSQFWR